MPYLVMKKIDGTITKEWELTDQPLVFGRGEQTDYQIHDERMSRRHFSIALRDKNYVIEDLQSTNGTYVNNVRVTEAALKANDRIRAGQTVLVFLAEKPKGIETVMGEIEKEGKGLKTYIRELDNPPSKPT
jgi:pSer/pThr/pTyr-binding forkhead associated (FHA) protein